MAIERRIRIVSCSGKTAIKWKTAIDLRSNNDPGSRNRERAVIQRSWHTPKEFVELRG